MGVRYIQKVTASSFTCFLSEYATECCYWSLYSKQNTALTLWTAFWVPLLPNSSELLPLNFPLSLHLSLLLAWPSLWLPGLVSLSSDCQVTLLCFLLQLSSPLNSATVHVILIMRISSLWKFSSCHSSYLLSLSAFLIVTETPPLTMFNLL